jgi:signal transduction histidine kinase/CheY-like chemotaxis protein
MNTATTVSIVCAAIELVLGVLALGFARAPGWRHLRMFALVAFSAAAFSFGNIAFSLEGVSAETILVFGRVNWAVGALHCGAWILYSRLQYGDRLRRRERVALFVLAVLGGLALIPGVMVTDKVEVQKVAWAHVTYHTPGSTDLGGIAALIFPLSLALPFRRYVEKTRLGVPGARAHFIWFCVLFLSVLNEVLVVGRVIDNLYLAEVGYLAAVVSVLSEMTRRVASDARRMIELSSDLSRQVDERTRELLEARDRLLRSERLSALGRLSASVGHEINNPLSYVMGNLDYVRNELAQGGASREILDALQDARGGAERIGKIVRELRVFGRGSRQERRVPTSLGEVLESSIKLVMNELRHRARLERDIQPVPDVLADDTRLAQVFVNLLLNAAQAMPEGRPGHSPLITVRTRTTDDGMALVEVSDNGIGISDDDMRRLFEPFFTTKPQDQGTGLGLFVSMGIISSLGGRIDVDSRVGHGTTVRVSLPAAPEDAGFSSISTIKAPVSVRNRRLLVIDDDALVARTLVRLLGEHRVEVSSSGQDGLRRLMSEGTSFDLVLCDLMMPDMSGMDLYEEIQRSLPALADRFVFISGGGVTERSRRFIDAHAARVLIKPIDGRELQEILVRRAAVETEGGAARTLEASA